MNVSITPELEAFVQAKVKSGMYQSASELFREALRLLHATKETPGLDLHGAVLFSLLGAVCSFLAGLVALKWLSQWLEGGRWYLFGIYCLLAAGVVEYLHLQGF